MAWSVIIVSAIIGAFVAFCVSPVVKRSIKNETVRRWVYLSVFFLALALGREFLHQPMQRYIAVEGFEEELLKGSSFVALKEFEPAIYNDYVQRAKLAIKEGASAAELRLQAESMVQALALKRVPEATNAAALEYMKANIQELEYLHDRGGDGCYTALFPDPDARDTQFKGLTAAMVRADSLALTEVLRTAKLQPQTTPTVAEFAKATQLAHPYIKEHSVEIENMKEKKVSLAARRQACETVIGMYKELFKLPPAEAGIAVRYVIAASSHIQRP